MTSSQQHPSIEEDTSSLVDDYTPTFYVGHHDSARTYPITEVVLRRAQDAGYDMITSPITTPYFHSRVLLLISSQLSSEPDQFPNNSYRGSSPAPIIPPLTPQDTHLAPGDVVSQIIACSSPWIDLCSPDPLIANISRQVLNLEIAYASFCGIGNVIIPGPRPSGSSDNTGLIKYARAIQEALSVGSYVQFAVQIPMYGYEAEKSLTGDLLPLARKEYVPEKIETNPDVQLFQSWDAWNLIRTVCKYNPRLSVALGLHRQLPTAALQSRWFAEPLRLLQFSPSTFLRNKGGHPVLSKAHQNLITRYTRLKQPPWLLLSDVGPIPGLEDSTNAGAKVDSLPSLIYSADASLPPTPAESTDQAKSGSRTKDLTAHLIYMRYLQRHQPPRTMIEKFGSGYQDYLQAPLQPLADNLESVTYEVFEKDPVKYDWYERAIAQALSDWSSQQKPTSSTTGAVVIAVTGAGRGPLVTRALQASEITGVKVEVWAVEKNPNAYVLLQKHNEEDWAGVVNVVKSDMRAWKGPSRQDTNGPAQAIGVSQPPGGMYGKVDIIMSELLGSFADNELSPECLDGVQHVLAPEYGISIPSSYTAHLTPILAPRLHADISHRAIADETATSTPYVVMLHAIDYLASSAPDHPRIQQAWEFVHPLPESILAVAEARRGGGVSGGGGGSMAGGDGANEHNSRYAHLKFICKDRGVVNGLAGYFEAVLYDGGAGEGGKVELSTRPDAINEKSKDMISWFPIFFPLKEPLYFPDDTELEVSIWRQTDDRKVWYEWVVEAFVMVGPATRLRVGMSDMGSSRKVGCLM
ncbi:hypothetical protein B7463_g1783, partial [Scytalidium lignicola]